MKQITITGAQAAKLLSITKKIERIRNMSASIAAAADWTAEDTKTVHQILNQER